MPVSGFQAFTARPRPVLVAVPLYRAAELIPDLFGALEGVGDEVASLGGSILLLNDSPDDDGLRAALDAGYPALRRRASVERIDNAGNLGFVGTANRALAEGLRRGADVVLLNSDALPTPGALTEMAMVAYSDPLIGFVSPRSDNATICNSPSPPSFRGLGRVEALAAHRTIQPYLPRVTYAPTAVGFCLYVKHLMLEEFGLLDPIYGRGYNEENDLVMRANLRGYRAALANHAFVHHIGTVSFKQSSASARDLEDVNRRILLERYPHYDTAVRRYLEGRHHQAERLLAGLVPTPAGRLRLLFDGRDLARSHNGTGELTRAVIGAFASQFASEFESHVVCDGEVAAFHGLDRIDGLKVLGPDELDGEPFAAAVKLAQPFRLTDLPELAALAPVSGYLFLDTIALDCQQLDLEDHGTVWGWMAETSAFLGFISQFSADQFARRFPSGPDAVRFVALCSTEVKDYPPAAPMCDGGHILLVGNHYPHKHVADTVAALRRRTDRPLAVLGSGAGEPQPGVTQYVAGEVPQDVVDALYDQASVVVFPSHYEGFGLPVMHALARGKPVIARDLEPLREIKTRCPDAINLHLHPTTAALSTAVAEGVRWRGSDLPLPAQSWADCARDVRNGIRAALERLTYDSLCARLLKLEACRRVGTSPQATVGRDVPAIPRVATIASAAEVEAWTRSSREGTETSEQAVYDVDDAGSDDESLLGRLFDLLDPLGPDDRLRLSVPRHFADSRARRLVLASGAMPAPAASSPDGRLDYLVRPFMDWRHLSGAPEDTQFVHSLYRMVLGRAGDPAGVRNYISELEEGRSRNDLLKVFCASHERRALVCALHGLAASD